jgi:hypothetical protein
VRSFPATADGGGTLPVSNDGGAQPRWRRDGKELFYVVNDLTVMAVDATTGTSLKTGIRDGSSTRPSVLFPAMFLSAM